MNDCHPPATFFSERNQANDMAAPSRWIGTSDDPHCRFLRSSTSLNRIRRILHASSRDEKVITLGRLEGVEDSRVRLCPSRVGTSAKEVKEKKKKESAHLSYAGCSSSLNSLYSNESSSARHDASMMFSLTPTVPQTASPSRHSITTRTRAAVSARALTTRTL